MPRALVLAGGGLTGIAWELGVLLGLRDEGVDVLDADLVVGTSAGSAVGAQLGSGVDLAELWERQRSDEHSEITPEFDLDLLATIFAELAGGRLPDEEGRARIGALALAAETVPEVERRRVIEARLPSHEWPSAWSFVVTAVDALTGAFVAFDRSSGVPLVDAVAASCAVPGVWPPVTIGDRRYVDGGVRSIANADLAAGNDPILLLAPMAGPALATLEPELAALRVEGATVVVVSADEEAAEAMGVNPLDPAYRRPAAEHGRRQGRAAAPEVGAAWAAATPRA